jgi:DNA adenine methylase
MPKQYKQYFEPFFGGGALLFATQPKKAIINDINTELINLYLAVRYWPNDLIKILKTYPDDSEFYYKIRSIDPIKMIPVQAAARTLYLNKCCYNGLYRVNKAGRFNVPYGKRIQPWKVDEETILDVAEYFNKNNIKFCNTDFRIMVNRARKGDFVYLDPPYDGTFTQYTSGGFDRRCQYDLYLVAKELTRRGVKVMISNSNTDFIYSMYSEDSFHIHTLEAKRNINSNKDKRGPVGEVIITNYKEAN